MAKSSKILLFLAFFFLLPAASAFAGFKLSLVSMDYRQDFRTGETPQFRVIVRNNETTSQFAEVDVTLVSTSTGTEFTLTPVLTGTIAAGGSLTLSRTYNLSTDAVVSGRVTPIPNGTYTASFPLFDGNGVKVDNLRGRFPIRIGTETESIQVFPETIQLGPIPPGRAMHPVPISVSWNMFRFDRLRQDQPFAIRIYTDNATRFLGVPGALHNPSPAGLVSLDGRYIIPIKVWCLNFGPDIQETGWDARLAGPPPVDDDNFWVGPPLLEGGRNLGSAAWDRVPDLVDMTTDPNSWRRLIGQDPHDTRFVSDINPIGDFTLRSPFTFYLATDAGAAAVEGSYATTLVVELWNP